MLAGSTVYKQLNNNDGSFQMQPVKGNDMDEQPIEKKKRYSVKTSSRGGARPNAGRKKGQPNKISAATILEQVQLQLGRPFEEQLVNNYMTCLANQDMTMIHQYDKLFLSKVVADKVEVDMRVTEDQLEAKKQAFVDAMNALAAKDKK